MCCSPWAAAGNPRGALVNGADVAGFHKIFRASHAEGDKVFFSEEKKQKTFDFSRVRAAWILRDRIK